MHIPDCWVVVKISGNHETIHKVFAVWRGGYCESDYWRLNSGIASVFEDQKAVIFKGHSGSEYFCHKDCYGLSGYGVRALDYIKARSFSTIEMLPATTDWSTLV